MYKSKIIVDDDNDDYDEDDDDSKSEERESVPGLFLDDYDSLKSESDAKDETTKRTSKSEEHLEAFESGIEEDDSSTSKRLSAGAYVSEEFEKEDQASMEIQTICHKKVQGKLRRMFKRLLEDPSSEQNSDTDIYVNPVSYFKCDDPMGNPLLNTPFVDKYGSTIKSDHALRGKDVVAVFFSHCNCERGANVLEILKSIHEKAEVYKKKFEVVYVSCDDTKEEMMNDLRVHHGKWFAIDYDEPIREGLRHFYGILAVPQIIVLNSFGETITRTGLEEVEDIGINVLVTWF